MIGRGYLRAVIGKPNREDIEGGVRIVVPIQEGVLYRLGEIKITDSKLFSPAQLLEMGSLKTGDIASGEAIGEWLFQRVNKAYSNFGYIKYTAEPVPDFHPTRDGAQEGVVDLTVFIEEGQAFTIRKIKLEGNGDIPESTLLREMLLRNGDLFSRDRFNDSLKIIDQMGIFEQIDSDKDVDYQVDNESARLDITIHLKKRT
jgi:outer membrane protein insertion porin family